MTAIPLCPHCCRQLGVPPPAVPDRVTFNEPGDWLGPGFALGLVDEIVISDAAVHLEMLTDTYAYLRVQGRRRDVSAQIRARPTTRAERRQVLAHTDDRLRDHLQALLPDPGLHMIWSVPWYRRPAAAVRAWWAARRAAGAVLCVDVEEDDDT